ncbi:MAG: tetratricopeptide repeat protein [Hyphomicrobiales bacterium]
METYRVFVSSPGDVLRERQRVERVVQRLNGEFSGLARLTALRWESSFYRAHATFQTQIPQAQACDVVVAIFRGRLGTELPPDFEKMANGEPYPSGTAYEVLTAIEKRQLGAELPDVYVFRCPEPPSVRLDDVEGEKATRQQWERLKTFFSRFFMTPEGQFKAAFQTFATTDDFESQLERLLREWLSHKVLRGRSVIWPIAIKGSPFPGLRSYGAEHSSVFFGRSRDVLRALDAWREAASRGTPFLLIVGASGAGKSSLLRAGLAPRLVTPGVVDAVDAWRIVEMRPNEGTGGPIAALAAALMRKPGEASAGEGQPFALPEIAEGAYATPSDLASLLSHADAAAVKPVLEALTRVAERVRQDEGFEREARCDLVLLVDQLDEVFAASVAVEDRVRFGKLLAELVATKRVWIAATLRADLYELLLREPSLFALKEQGAAFDLSPPGIVELAEIVRNPAEAAGLVYERDPATGEGLDERLLRDAERPDMLPLLQLALARLFEARETIGEETRLTLAAYHAQGGLSGIIDRAGEEALADLDERAVASLPRLLRHLAEPSHERERAASLTARDVALAEVAPDEASRSLVAALVEARLLQSRGESGGAIIHLSHQRVLSDWARAKIIVGESADFYRIRDETEARRQAYEASGRRAELLLPRGLPLAEAESVVRRYGDEVSSEARAFVQASRRRANRAQGLTAIAAGLFALLAVGAGIFAKIAVDQRREAQAQKTIAEKTLEAAEGAVHGLIFDVAQSLRDLAGMRVETVRKILERVRRTVDALGEQAPADPTLLRDRATMLNEFVKTYLAVGDLAAAETAARQSLDLFQGLAKLDENDPRRRRDLMLAINELGVVEDGLGNRTQALALYEQGMSMASELVQRDPDAPQAKADLALSFERIAGLRLGGGDRVGAGLAYEQGIAILRSLVARDQVDDQWRFGLSDLLDGEGAVLLAGGDRAGALKAYEESVTIVRALSASEPDNNKWAATLTTRLGELGSLRLKMNDATGALRAFDEALTLCRTLVARDRDNAEWQRNLATTLSKFADAKLALREREAAIRAYEESLSIGRELAVRDPDNVGWRLGVSIELERLADLKQEARDFAGAKAAFEEMLAIRRALVARDPDNADWRRDLSIALQRLADIERAMGDAKHAVVVMQESVDTARALVAKDPDYAEWQLDLAIGLTDLGDIRLAASDAPGARTTFEELVAVARGRLARQSGDQEWRRVLSVGLERLGDLLRASGDRAGAQAAFEESLALRRSALMTRPPDDIEGRRDLMIALNRLGDIHLEANAFAQARPLYEESLAIARALALVAPGDPLTQSDLSEALERIAKIKVFADDDAGAAEAYQEAVALWRRLSSASPEDQAYRRALALDLQLLGNTRYLTGDYTQAAHAFDELASLLRDRLAKLPDDLALRAQLATALDRLALSRSQLKDAAGELAAKSENLANRRVLLAGAPADAALQAALLADFDRVVDLIVAAGGSLAASAAASREALASARLLAQAEPEDPKRQAGIAQRLKQLGDLRAAAHDEAGALAFYGEAVPIARRLAAANPSDVLTLLTLDLILDKIGDMREADRQGALAASLEQLAVSRRLAELNPKEPLWRVALALTLVKVAIRSDDATAYLAEARWLAREFDGETLSPQLFAWVAVLKRFVLLPQAPD